MREHLHTVGGECKKTSAAVQNNLTVPQKD